MKGYLSARAKTGGGIDEPTGLPNPETESWSDLTECQYSPNNRSTVGAYKESEFRIASYEITVNMLDWKTGSPSMIKLLNSRKEGIAQKEVLTFDEHEAIQRIKITI